MTTGAPQPIQNVSSIALSLLGFASTDIPGILQDVAALVVDEWRRVAHMRLHGTAEQYADSIQIVSVSPRTVVIALTDSLANMIELGAPAWDMRETILKSAKAKTSKAGHKYMSIPFRHMTPGSSSRFGSVMPKAIHKEARALRATISGADAWAAVNQLDDPDQKAFHGKRINRSKTNTLWGGIGDGSAKRGRLPPGLAPIEKPWHATDRYDGMVRMEKTYKAAKQSTYMTFRTISTNIETMRDAHGRPVLDSMNRAENWRHPGFTALNLRDGMAQYAMDHAFPIILGT